MTHTLELTEDHVDGLKEEFNKRGEIIADKTQIIETIKEKNRKQSSEILLRSTKRGEKIFKL